MTDEMPEANEGLQAPNQWNNFSMVLIWCSILGLRNTGSGTNVKNGLEYSDFNWFYKSPAFSFKTRLFASFF